MASKKNLSKLGNAYQALNNAEPPAPPKSLANLGNVYAELNKPFVPQGNLLGLNRAYPTRGNLQVSPNLAGLFDDLGPFTAGIFLDNDREHRASVQNACRHAMTVVEVPETRYFRGTLSVTSTDYAKFVEKMSPTGKDAANVLARLCKVAGNSTELYDAQSGIRNAQVAQIRQWVDTEAAKPNSRLVAIFDFDRTLSVMEGGFFLGNSIYEMKKILVERVGKQQEMDSVVPAFTAEGFAEYLAGGTERMTMLQDMFTYLYDHNVRVILLTNNGGCPRARNLFRELMMVYTRGRPFEIICGVDYAGNKGVAIMGKNTNTGNLKSLRQMCTVRAGGVRKKTKKSNRNRKTKTRRHR